MTPPPFEPSDQTARERIVAALDETLFVEAGAGTGKTTALVERIVALVRTGHPIAGVTAITFTDAAAAELRQRVRTRLEEETHNAERLPMEQRFFEQAARSLDAAALQTLHSFAKGLLQERPLEAGLPPGFRGIEQIEADLNFQERWEQWLDVALEDAELAPHLTLTLASGVDFALLKQLAKSLHEHYDLVPEALPVPPSDTVPSAAQAIIKAGREIESLLRLSRLDGDLLAEHGRKVVGLGRTVQRLDRTAALVTLARWGRLSTGRGRQTDWDFDRASRKNGATALKDLLNDLEELRADELAAARAQALPTLLNALIRLVKDYEAERKQAGHAEFNDLLVWARNLLRDNPEARAYFRARYTHILVDEFQDTDPLQAELAFLLASEALTNDWRASPPKPGKLFLVGDPKQSIYRFRRADIAITDEVKTLIATDGVVPLQQNFRSHPSIIAWVNTIFTQWMQPLPKLQATYLPLSPLPSQTPRSRSKSLPHSDGEGQDGVPSRVYRFGGALDASANEARGVEAVALAKLLAHLPSLGWTVTSSLPQSAGDSQPASEGERAGVPRPLRQEQDGVRPANRPPPTSASAGHQGQRSSTERPATWKDVALLIPARTGLRELERALEEAVVPYRLESQSLILGTQDVRDLLNCLRAIDSPADQIGVVAALRSPAFACNDADLLRHVELGHDFNYLSSSGAPGSSLPQSAGDSLPLSEAARVRVPRPLRQDQDGVRKRLSLDGRDHREGDGVPSPVAEGLATLRDLHEQSMWQRPEETLEELIRRQRMVEACFAYPRPRERWRRLRFVVEQARSFRQVAGGSLREFIDWMERQAAEGTTMIETPSTETDEDAVRIMTVHASKGLEFPIVILANLGSDGAHRTDPVLFDRASGQLEVRLGRLEPPFATPGFDAAREHSRQADEAEHVRLMYVATTRARDHLIVSLYRSAKAERSPAARFEQFTANSPELWQELLPPPASAVPSQAAFPPAQLPERELFLAERMAAIQRASRPAALSVTGLTKLRKPDDLADELPYRRGRGGTSLGRAVHAVLQSIDLATGGGLEAIAAAQATAEGIPQQADEIAGLVRNALKSEVVRRAVRSGTYYRELFLSIPVVAREAAAAAQSLPSSATKGSNLAPATEGNANELSFENAPLVEGFVDLLFEEEGELVIVDYKTDSLDDAAAMEQARERYALQVGLYALAVSRLTHRPVREAVLLFLRPSREERFEDVATLTKAAETGLVEALQG